MFSVEPVPRGTIDSWPVSEAGMPTRVINSVNAAGVKTIGQLRNWPENDLLRLRSLGKVSLDQINYFFKLCNRIEKGNQRFASIHEVLDIFLDVPQLNVMTLRYGCYQQEITASRNWVTLQEIGNRENKTRERIRQVEELGKEKLRSRMARVCLQPFYAFFTAFINQRARVVATRDLAALRNHEALRELNPAAILLLLSDLNPDLVGFRHDYFTTLPPAAVARIERNMLATLNRSDSPISVDGLTGALGTIPDLPEGADLRQAAAVIADHHPTIGASIDNRYFLYTSSVRPFVVELMERLEQPVHYRTVTSTFNDRVKPRSRKGAGYVLDVLNHIRVCRRVDRGIYTLAH